MADRASGLSDPPRAAAPAWAAAPLKGENYLTVMRRGCATSCGRAAIGIDPAFQIPHDAIANKPSCCLFRMTSDAFFADHDPTAVFGRPIDIAFLDGMHWFECLAADRAGGDHRARPVLHAAGAGVFAHRRRLARTGHRR